MQTPIEKLARKLAKEPKGELTLGQLAEKHHETLGRILDAQCVLELLTVLGALDEAPITYIEVR